MDAPEATPGLPRRKPGAMCFPEPPRGGGPHRLTSPSKTWKFKEIGEAHQVMYGNRHPAGNMALLVNAPCEGLKDLPR